MADGILTTPGLSWLPLILMVVSLLFCAYFMVQGWLAYRRTDPYGCNINGMRAALAGLISIVVWALWGG